MTVTGRDGTTLPGAGGVMSRRRLVRPAQVRSLPLVRHGWRGIIGAIFTKRKLDDAALEELEELLIAADLGVADRGQADRRAVASKRFDKEVSARGGARRTSPTRSPRSWSRWPARSPSTRRTGPMSSW